MSLQGGTHWFLMQITPLQEIGGGAVISHLDITDRVAAEKALKVQHEFTQRLFDTGQNIVLVLDTEGRIVSFNRYLELLAGWRLDEVKGQSWFAPTCHNRFALKSATCFSVPSVTNERGEA